MYKIDRVERLDGDNEKKEEFYKRIGGKVIFIGIEVIAFVITILLSATKGMPLDMFIVIMFVMSMTVTVSEYTYLGNIHNSILDMLGEIAMPIFCLQYPVYDITNRLIHIRGQWQNLLGSYIILMLVSFILVKLILEPWNIFVKKVLK